MHVLYLPELWNVVVCKGGGIYILPKPKEKKLYRSAVTFPVLLMGGGGRGGGYSTSILACTVLLVNTVHKVMED